LIASLTKEQFEKHKKSLGSKLNEKFKNLGHESSRLWSHVTSRYYDFNQNQNDATFIETITQGEVVDFYAEYLHPDATKRRKLSVHIVSKKCSSKYTADQQVAIDRIRSSATILEAGTIDAFTKGMALTGYAQPVVPLSTFLI
jgi:insulysin